MVSTFIWALKIAQTSYQMQLVKSLSISTQWLFQICIHFFKGPFSSLHHSRWMTQLPNPSLGGKCCAGGQRHLTFSFKILGFFPDTVQRLFHHLFFLIRTIHLDSTSIKFPLSQGSYFTAFHLVISIKLQFYLRSLTNKTRTEIEYSTILFLFGNCPTTYYFFISHHIKNRIQYVVSPSFHSQVAEN